MSAEMTQEPRTYTLGPALNAAISRFRNACWKGGTAGVSTARAALEAAITEAIAAAHAEGEGIRVLALADYPDDLSAMVAWCHETATTADAMVETERRVHGTDDNEDIVYWTREAHMARAIRDRLVSACALNAAASEATP